VGSAPDPSLATGTLTFDGQLVTLMRNYRSQMNLPALKWHEGMAKAAAKHTTAMNTLAQTTLVTNGVDPATRMVSSSPPMKFTRVYQFVAEIVGAPTAAVFFDRLLQNPAVKAAIEDRRVGFIGLNSGAARGTYLFGVDVEP
jgi:hypothetical protein